MRKTDKIDTEEKLVSIYYDQPSWCGGVDVDDFIVTIGKSKSNTVYHVAEVKKRPTPKHDHMIRHHLKCYKTDLLTALNRDLTQQIHPMVWYKREKKNAKN